jgi:hypothetical protein
MMGVPVNCFADRPFDRFGPGDVFLVVPSEYWSRANEIAENVE